MRRQLLLPLALLALAMPGCAGLEPALPAKLVGYGYDEYFTIGVKRSGLTTSTSEGPWPVHGGSFVTSCQPAAIRGGDWGLMFFGHSTERRIIGVCSGGGGGRNQHASVNGNWLSCWINDQIISLSDYDTSWVQTCAWCGNGICEAHAGECNEATFCAADCCEGPSCVC